MRVVISPAACLVAYHRSHSSATKDTGVQHIMICRSRHYTAHRQHCCCSTGGVHGSVCVLDLLFSVQLLMVLCLHAWRLLHAALLEVLAIAIGLRPFTIAAAPFAGAMSVSAAVSLASVQWHVCCSCLCVQVAAAFCLPLTGCSWCCTAFRSNP
jgi:hypothetical protein